MSRKFLFFKFHFGEGLLPVSPLLGCANAQYCCTDKNIEGTLRLVGRGILNWDIHCWAFLWLGAGNGLLWFVFPTLLFLSLSLFLQCEPWRCSSLSLNFFFFSDLYVGQKALIPAQWFQYHLLHSHRPTLSPCEHPVEDSISLGSVPYFPYTLQLLLVIIKSCSFEAFHNCFSSNLSQSTT